MILIFSKTEQKETGEPERSCYTEGGKTLNEFTLFYSVHRFHVNELLYINTICFGKSYTI